MRLRAISLCMMAIYSFFMFLWVCLPPLSFWAVEYAFHLTFVTDAMRYVGGVIGLAIGFHVKYKLDKKFVFISDDK